MSAGTSNEVVAVRHPATRVHGIFCLEIDWWSDLEPHRSFTVRPIFELVSQMHPKLRFIHRTVATIGELDHYLARWTQAKYAAYPILYLAMHGSPGHLYLGEGSRAPSLGLDDLAQRLSGRCRNRVVHLASCGSVDTHGANLKRFLKVTGAHAVSGYTADVGMLEPSAFEVLMLDRMQYHKLDKIGIRAIDRRLKELASPLRKQLGFRFVTV